MYGTQLNLARKWRSQHFDQIVGQALPVRMLKNSLYLGSFFPVYLFSGQRGCGKTTTARVFACAVNCQALPVFRQNPKSQILPCLTCNSCKAMLESRHPDFIEIDAASHTGVDNVRQIIEAASLLPTQGSKKIYLIDEAHMLSKAAFNAFLKILEEPPVGVLFILATTDPNKIIETVRSRCFQLFFTAIDTQSLLDHLKMICAEEKIVYDTAGLELIIKVSQGSARDAINVLEQVRFSTTQVTKEAVQAVLGHIDEVRMISLVKTLLYKDPAVLLSFLKEARLTLFSAEDIWYKLIDLVRVLVWLKYRVDVDEWGEHKATLTQLARDTSLERLSSILDMLYEHESLFLKTSAQHTLLEMIFLKVCRTNKNHTSGDSSPQNAAAPEYIEPLEEDNETEEIEEEQEDGQAAQAWKAFVIAVQAQKDPLLTSIITQAVLQRFDQATSTVEVVFSKDLHFFKNWLEDSKATWQPLLQQAFGNAKMVLQPLFTGAVPAKESVPTVQPSTSTSLSTIEINSTNVRTEKQSIEKKVAPSTSYRTQVSSYSHNRSHSSSQKGTSFPSIDVSDAGTWKNSALLLKYFPGSVREIKEVSYEQKT